MKNQSFAALFRQSAFAQWHPSTPIHAFRAKPVITPYDHTNVDEAQRPIGFGLKRDLPCKFWGDAPSTIRIRKIDADYEQTEFEHDKLSPLRTNLLTNLQRLDFGDEPVKEETTEDIMNDILGLPVNNCQSRTDESPPSTKTHPNNRYWLGEKMKTNKRPSVYGRLLHRAESGYQIMVAGITCTLPLYEIPQWGGFSMEDVVQKRVFKFFIKSCEFGPNGPPNITLSLREM